MASPSEGGGVKALQQLKSVEPPLWLSPSPELSQAARAASEHLFSSLRPFCSKSPFDRLLVNGFDTEQIWQQIDLQTHPLLFSLRRELKQFERNPEEISKGFGERRVVEEKSEDLGRENGGVEGSEEEFEGVDGEEDLGFDVDDGVENDDEEDEEVERGGDGGIGDRFLKIKELEEYMEDDEAREYGVSKRKQRGEEEDDDDEDEDNDIEGLAGSGSEDEDSNARYEDFFGGKKGKSSKSKLRSLKELKDLDSDNEEASEDFDEDANEDYESENESDEGLVGRRNREEDSSKNKREDDDGLGQLKEETLSTHEKQLEKLRLKIEEMEKANMEPKTWTMQGEVTAAKRPKNSALEVDLDFKHNVRPAPVITEEVTTSLEDLIKTRILDGRFDDVQRLPSLPSKGPKEKKELDENKSKMGLAEIYEEEYTQKTGLASAPLSFSNEQKKEASLLFKKICLKLDALSHFHFTPKPIIEDMSVQANVPALAMEEIAPTAVSDAAMLAPEEVFAGKGDIKEEAELTQAERKRRRASKKRKFKAEITKRMEKKARNTNNNDIAGKDKEES